MVGFFVVGLDADGGAAFGEFVESQAGVDSGGLLDAEHGGEAPFGFDGGSVFGAVAGVDAVEGRCLDGGGVSGQSRPVEDG